ncbi:hypothetical protein EK21DRAFT_113725 [Setomelanomma holmii]|uniref:Uncharacterized protein n=1 Tax=Setomelanomma holmii TaxID=210430 RepID=A0A9P4H5H7_9PLEO|nr:hypothetical protein EK21DRAFT_113725 [Setomelanomma holmii]
MSTQDINMNDAGSSMLMPTLRNADAIAASRAHYQLQLQRQAAATTSARMIDSRLAVHSPTLRLSVPTEASYGAYTAPTLARPPENPVRHGDAYDNFTEGRSRRYLSSSAYAFADAFFGGRSSRRSRPRHNNLRLRRGHAYINMGDRQLIEARQARALAGLSTMEMDEEITYRATRDRDDWGELGRCVYETEWGEAPRCFCERDGCDGRFLIHDNLGLVRTCGAT